MEKKNKIIFLILTIFFLGNISFLNPQFNYFSISNREDLNSSTWTNWEQVLSLNFRYPDLSINKLSGKLHFIGRDSSGIQYTSRDWDGSWSSTYLVSSDTITKTYPRISSNTDDEVLVTYKSDDGSYDDIKGKYKSQSGTWSSEYTIADESLKNYIRPIPLMHEDGKADVIFSESEDDDFDFSYSTNPGSSWAGGIEKIANQEYDQTAFMDLNDRPGIIYGASLTNNGGSADYRMKMRFWTGSSFTTPEEIPTGTNHAYRFRAVGTGDHSHSLGSDPICIVFSYSDNILKYVEERSGIWSSVETISTTFLPSADSFDDHRGFDIDIDDQGNVHVAYIDTSNNIAYRKRQGGTWNDVETFTNPNSGYTPSVRICSYENGYVALLAFAGSNSLPTYLRRFDPDVDPPIITVNSPNGNFYGSAPLMDVDFSDIGGLDDAYYKVDSYTPTGLDTTGWTPIFTDHSGTSYTTDFTIDSSIWDSLGEGNHIVYFKAWDDSGNINDGSSPSWQFYKDTGVPSITVNIPSGNYYTSAPLMDVDFSDVGDLDDAYYKVDSYIPTGLDTTGWAPIFTDHSGTSYTADFAMDSSVWNGLSEGSHTVYFKAWDDSGYINDGSSPSWQFYKDTGAPSIAVNIPSGNYYASAPLMDVDFLDNYELDDAYYKVDSYTPTGLDTTGWAPIFIDHSGTSYTTDFAMDSSVWNGLSEGSHTVYYKAWDDSGNINDGSSPSWQFYKDTGAPSIAVNIPSGNYYTSAPLMDVDFLDNYELDDAYYKVDSYIPTGLDTTGWAPIFTDHSGTSYTTDFAMDSSVWNGLSEGNHTVYYKAWDDSGNINDGSSPSWQFYKDTGAPSITVNIPSGNYYTSAPLMDVDFFDISGLDDAFYKVDSYTPTGLDTTGWAPIFTDHSGTSYTTDFAMDSSVWNGLSEGNHTVYYKAWDDSGYINDGSSPSWQFYKDTGAPSIAVNIPSDNYYTSAPLMDVDFLDNYELDDAYYKVDSYTPTGLDTTGWAPIFTDHSGTSYTTDFAMDSSVWNGLSEGNHTVYYKAWDDSGNINDGSSPSWQFYKDTELPSINVNSLNDNYYTSAPLMDVDFFDIGGLDDAYYKVDSYTPTGLDTTGWAPIFTDHSGTSYTTDFAMDSSVWNGLSEGSHTVYFKAWDDSGNINDGSSPSWQFYKDINPPIITINTLNGSYFDSSPMIDVDFSDIGGLDDAYYKVDSYTPTGFGTTGWTQIFTDHSGTSYTTDFTIDSSIWDSLGEGNHIVYFKAWDDSGNINDGSSPSWQFYKVNDPLTISINIPDGNYYISAPLMDVDFSDALGLDNAYYKVDFYTPTGLDTTGWTPIFTDHSGTSYSTDFAMDSSIWNGLSEGNHTVYFKAWDDEGIIKDGVSLSWQFYKDTIIPLIILKSPGDNSVRKSGTQIVLNITDSNGLNNILYKWDSAASNSTYSPLNPPTIPTGDGLHLLYVFAYDNAGNFGNKTFFFICDDTNPNATFEGIDEGMVIEETITITVSASDENGISHIIFFINDYQTANQSNNYDFSLDTKSYIDDDYVFKFRVYDLAGNYFEQQFSIEIKNKDTPPIIPGFHLELLLGISLISIVIFTLKKYREQQRKGVHRISFN